MPGLYDDADLYDLVSPRDESMERFYVDIAGGPGRTVLELACGSGRFTIPLAESGAQTTGADLSEIMIEKAESRALTRGLDVHFFKLDMRDFELNALFDCVIVAANSLLHLHTSEDFARAFAAIRRHLAPGGILAFDIFVPSAYMLSRHPDERQHVGKFSHSLLGEISVEETISYNPITQVSHSDWYWSTVTEPEFRHTSVDMRQIYPQELPLLLQHNGFELLSRYGDFDKVAFDVESRRQVCLCR